MLRILIIDDSAKAAAVVADRIHDADIDIALSFTEALTLVNDKTYNAIIVDVEKLPVERVHPKDLFLFLKKVHGSTIVITNHKDGEQDARTLDEALHRLDQTDLIGLANDMCARIKRVQAKIEANC